MLREPAIAGRRRAAGSTTCWSTSTRTPTRCRREILLALKPDGRGRHRGRRRRAGDLLPSAPPPCATSSTSRASSRRRRAMRHARAELPLDAADPGRRQRRDRRWRPSATPRSCSRPAAPSAQRPAAGHGARRAGPGRATWSSRCSPTARRACRCATRRCCSAPRSHSAALELELAPARHPVRQVRRAAASSRRRTSRTCWPSCAGPRTRATRSPAFRVLQLLPGIGPGTAAQGWLRPAGERRRSGSRRCRLAAAAAAERWPGLVGAAARAAGGAAGRPQLGPGARLLRPAARASCTTTSPRAAADLDQLERMAAARTLARAVPDRAHPRSAGGAGGDAGGAAAQGRGLADPVDDPLGQGAGVARGVRAQRGRRLHPVGHGDRHARRASRRSGGCSTWR